MTDIEKALAFVREDIEMSTSLGDDDDLAEMRRIEVLLMKQERMEAEWDALRAELKAMAEKVQEVAERNKALEEAVNKDDHDHGLTIGQRDRAEKFSDDLSAEISRISGVSIGEHSSINCPWQNALKLAADVPEFSDLYRRIMTLEEAVSEAQFLCERLREYESDSNQSDDDMRIWIGHVVPPLARSEKAVSEALKGGDA